MAHEPWLRPGPVIACHAWPIAPAGEIDMLLAEGEVHLRAGDVQQASNHAWVNRGRERCRFAFILIDSEKP